MGRCVCIVDSNMLLKVKPDGPVYEVHFTSQLISASDNAKSIGPTQLQAHSASRSISVTSASCKTCPVVSSVPPSVISSHGQMTGNVAAVTEDNNHMLKSSTSSTQQTQTCRLPFPDGQAVSRDILSCNAVTNTVNSVRYASGSPANTKALENLVTTRSSVQSDAADCW